MRRRGKTPETETSESTEEALAPMTPPRRVVLRSARLPFRINWVSLLLVIGLIAVTAFALLMNQGMLPNDVIRGWPVMVAALAILWFLAALVRRSGQNLLASTALFGLSVSLLLAAEGIVSLWATLVGVTFIALGTGIILRGLLLRHQPIG